MNDGKSFKSNFPITVAIRIASTIEIIMKNNEKVKILKTDISYYDRLNISITLKHSYGIEDK